ncbi:hypothetical protein [Arthrobacter sp. CJ23]|uniref:hypothetical protein n=1 Tax=Arthrobacter sp. CJ23 TaxID=2972479 RepID=UPI00215C0E7C|nr:hypothetical protein [Arthrobacter sp. CJ23]UVJ41717.1 hypothetical protein NVV90_04160 [Arthrobacter sp. CJ23]
MDRLTGQMESALKAAQFDANVQCQIGERGLTVKLVGSQALFLPDRPELTPRASQILDAIAPALAPDGEPCSPKVRSRLFHPMKESRSHFFVCTELPEYTCRCTF